jgi:MFS family permease
MVAHTLNHTPSQPRLDSFPWERIAVSALFLINGFVVGSWAPKIPEFAARLDLSEFGLGLMILGFGVGSLLAMPLVGAANARYGSSRIVRLLGFATCPTLLLITLAPTVATAAVTVMLLGALVGGMDIAMNVNAVAVEKRMRRAIMSSCHGFWSLGGLLGAVLGGPMIVLLGILGHALAVMMITLIILLAVSGKILHDAPAATGETQRLRLPASPLPYLLGVVALFSMIPEGAVLDWGALYLRQELGADLVASGFGFGAFSATMAIMRFAGDRVRNRFGAVATLRICTVFALVGFLAAGFSAKPILVIAGFAVAGIGISNMIPIAFSAAGNLPGLPAGIGLSIVTFMGYSGLLAAPSVIGFIGEYISFSVVFIGLSSLFVVVLGLSHLVAPADNLVACVSFAVNQAGSQSQGR